MSPAPVTTCSACGANAVSNGVCGRCGFASGDANKCPHCGSIARVEPKGSGASLHWVCGVCGGPRMPSGAGGEASASPLREAKASFGLATRARAVSWVFGIIATFMTLVTLAGFSHVGIVAKIIFLALAIAPTLMAVRARSKATRATASGAEAVDRAMLAAAEKVAGQSKKGVTVAELAALLKIDAVKAEHLLTQLAVHDRTRIDVDDDAEVRYSVTPELGATGTAGEGRVRIASSEDQFRALEEAEAAAESKASEKLANDEEELKKMLTAPFGRGPGR